MRDGMCAGEIGNESEREGVRGCGPNAVARGGCSLTRVDTAVEDSWLQGCHTSVPVPPPHTA